ncbi:MAG: DUF302 domain-containing protein [Polyangiaceae bacterium]|nr:DUF302 domain-containing protein [Polyangiaceae bacterium]
MESNMPPDYTLTREAPHLSQGQALERVKALLAEEGFGVLTTIDVAATLKAKLGVEREPYVILGACNPPLAHRALEAEPAVGVLLPCNVDVYQLGGRTIVQAVNPRKQFELVSNPGVAPIAEEVAQKLERVLEKL